MRAFQDQILDDIVFKEFGESGIEAGLARGLS